MWAIPCRPAAIRVFAPTRIAAKRALRLERRARDAGSGKCESLENRLGELNTDLRSFPPSHAATADVPTHNSLWPDDGYGVKNARTATIEPNEQGAVGPTQMQSAWCALLQDIELMPQYRDFGFQPPLRLEAVAQHADEKEGNCNHATIML
jgi:hypothetical protein